jgi:predicted ATP-dependent endonuclease of OLD family
MIHEITIENFGSVRDELTINFRVARNAPDMDRFRRSLSQPDVRLPTVAAFVGPNGSGKSTILRAVIATLQFLINSSEIDPGSPIQYVIPFLKTTHTSKPTRIEVTFDARWLSEKGTDADIFRYELELGREESLLVPTKVTYEALFYAPHGKWRRVFEHKEGSEVFLIREFGLKKTEKSIRDAISSNRSVISVLARLFQNPFATRIWRDLANLQTNLVTLTVNVQQLAQWFSERPERLEQLNRDIRRIDVGISKMGIYQSTTGPSLYAEHHGLDTPLVFESESSGTQHFIFLFPGISFVLETGHILLVDDFDRDLHPDLVLEILSWFQSSKRNLHGAQLLCTLHNTAILESLEKEELFLVEKSSDGTTDVWSAQDVKGLRRQPSLYRKYSQGALGAVPRIG